MSRREQILYKINQQDEECLWQRPDDELIGYRATTMIQPKLTAAVLEFKKTAPSVQYCTLTHMMKSRFLEVVKEKDHILGDRLDALSRERVNKLGSKFHHDAHYPSVDMALRSMRDGYRAEVAALRKQNTHKNIELYHPWYKDLMKSAPDDLKNSWYWQKVMKKLEKYGMVEAGTQSTFKFQRVLSGLRVWELCSPDVSAAIEFCRERILELPIDEYEAWFHENFPQVARPPVAIATDENEAAADKLDWPTNGASYSRRPIKSAPPRLRHTTKT